MKIRLKLIIGFLVVVLLVGVIGYFGVSSLQRINGEFDKVSEEIVPVIDALEDLRFSGLKIVAATKGRVKASEKEISQEEKEIKEGRKLYDNAFRQYEDLVNRFFPEEKESLEKIRISGEKLQKASAEIIESKEFGLAVLEAKGFEKSAQGFLKLINAAIANIDEEFGVRQESLKSAITTAINLIYIASITAFIIAILISLFISRSISKPIQELSKASGELKKGNFDYKINITSKDEIGELAATFDNMRLKIKNDYQRLNLTLVQNLQKKIKELEQTKQKLKKKSKDKKYYSERNA